MRFSNAYTQNTICTPSRVSILSGQYCHNHGIHGIDEKAPDICSDAVCRVPMIWRAPGVTRPARVDERLIENVDITPTLAALCGLPPPDSTDGLDASGLLEGGDEPLHEIAVTENAWSKALRWGR